MPHEPRAASRSRFGVVAASFPVSPPRTSCARSPRPSSRKTTIGYIGAEAIPRADHPSALPAVDGDSAALAFEVPSPGLVDGDVGAVHVASRRQAQSEARARAGAEDDLPDLHPFVEAREPLDVDLAPGHRAPG